MIPIREMNKFLAAIAVCALAVGFAAGFNLRVHTAGATNSRGSWLITAYAPPARCGDSGRGTATGHSTHQGTIAVDPSVIRLGTKLWVEGYGYGVADDTGGAVRGHHVDVWMSSCTRAVSFTRYGVVKVVG